MAIRILEVDSSSAVAVIDLASLLLRGVSPVGQPAIAHPGENRVELALADQKGIVLRNDIAGCIHVVEIDVVLRVDHLEWSPVPRRRETEDLRQEGRRGLAVASP